MATSKSKSKKSYDGPSPEEVLVQDLITLMEQGKTPWRKPWSGGSSHHINLLSGHAYRGSNIILLEMGMAMRGAALPYWCGAAEAKKHGVFPKKGSKSVRILRPQLNKRQEAGEDGETVERTWTSFKVVPIFNVIDLQGDGLADLIEEAKHKFGYQDGQVHDHQRIAHAEEVLEAWEVEVIHGGHRACYAPAKDQIMLPEFTSFESAEAYYATRAHEAIHSTGHSSRLDRGLCGVFGSQSYAKEELVAELGSVLLCHQLQITSELTNHAAYLSSWIEVLKEEPKALFKILSAANKAAQLILGEKQADPSVIDGDQVVELIDTKPTVLAPSEQQELCLV